MVAISKSRVKQRQIHSRKEKTQEKLLLMVLAALVCVYGVVKIAMPSSTTSSSLSSSLTSRWTQERDDHRPHLNLQSSQILLSEAYNAIAKDILDTLDCENLLNKTADSMAMMKQDGEGMYDDVGGGEGGQEYRQDFSGGGGGGLDSGDNQRLQQRRLQEKDPLLEQGRELLGENNNANREGGGGAAATDDGDDSLKDTNKEKNENGDDRVMGGEAGQDDFGGWQGYQEVTAKELFCLAAATTSLPVEKIKLVKERIQCDAADAKQRALLDLWSSARAQMSESLLLKTLELATESSRSLGTHTVNLWAPRNDDGINFVLNQVSNEEESARLNGNNFYGLSHNLGPDHLYVDVGSCLGITTLAVILQYPKTRVVSVEPAAPNWLMQEINMKCNLEDHQQPTILLAGVGPHNKETMAAKLLWRPSAVTATRAWTPAEEQIKGEDEELFVQLRPWKSILAEGDILSSHHIDVLHVDCEGCEYNLIPALTDSEFESIDTVMGELHWGYIPLHKLPSSKRGQLTHDRLCQHENFARTAKECCGNLELQVRSSIPGEVLYRDTEGANDRRDAATVRDMIGDELCSDFSTWVEEHHFYNIESDFGWFEMTSVAK